MRTGNETPHDDQLSRPRDLEKASRDMSVVLSHSPTGRKRLPMSCSPPRFALKSSGGAVERLGTARQAKLSRRGFVLAYAASASLCATCQCRVLGSTCFWTSWLYKCLENNTQIMSCPLNIGAGMPSLVMPSRVKVRWPGITEVNQ